MSSAFATVAAMASAVLLGCGSAQTPRDASIDKPDSVTVGERYLISTGSEARGAKYTGRVTEVNIDSIVMAQPHVEAWAEHSWPLVGKIPGNHPFKNGKGVAREKPVGDVTIDRDDIVAIEPVAEGG